MRLPLEGIRVLDLTMVVAGPYCTMLLGDWGAEVIRLDTTQVFIPYTRGTSPRPPREFVEAVKTSGYGYAGNNPGERPWNRYTMFQNHARNKLSMTAALRTQDGQATFEGLVAIADVLVENNVPVNLAKLGVSWERVRKLRPDLIMLRMPPYGLGGAYENYRAFGSHIEAVNGHLSMRGYSDCDVSMRGVLPIADGPSGIGGALAVVMALRHRARTGQGQLVELSQTEHFATYLGEAMMDYAINRREACPQGNRHARFAPHGCYPCKGADKWVTIAVFTEEQWIALRRVMGDPEWAADPRFGSHQDRRAHHDELDGLIGQWTRRLDHFQAMHILQEAGVPAGAVIDEAEACGDPQLLARGFFQRLTHEECGTHMYPGFGFRMEQTPNAIRTPPCRMGEHNDYVYRDLLAVPNKEYGRRMDQGHIGMDYGPEVR